MIEKMWKWLVEAIRETLALSWTILGLVISYLTLSGQAATITGVRLIITLTIWLLTISFRKNV